MEANNKLEILAAMEYLGRAPFVGRSASGAQDVAGYLATGRSQPSRERRFDIQSDNSVVIRATSQTGEVKGNPKLLFYNAVRMYNLTSTQLPTIFVTNGAQTDLVYNLAVKDLWSAKRGAAASMLCEAFGKPHEVPGNKPDEKIDLACFEPDAPNNTPRVNAVLHVDDAAMCTLLCNGGQLEKRIYDIPLIPGILRMLPTYSGTNVPSGVRIPSFEGAPLSIPFAHKSAQDLANSIYESLGPKEPGEGIIEPGKDMRVGVVVFYRDRETGVLDYGRVNMDDLRNAA